MSKLKYIGERIVDLIPDEIYDAKETTDTMLGDCYSIKDGSGEWYLYDKEYVDKNFKIVA